MFRLFEDLVDPYAPYSQDDRPKAGLWPFFRDYSRVFYPILAVALVTSVLVAVMEIGLIWYLGRVVDILSGDDRQQIWSQHKTELIAVAVFVLSVRPLLQAVDVALLNNAILPNFGTLIRWRAHGRVLRQSIGWFESDFAGRIANRIMQTPPAAGEALFQVLDAIAFALAYLVGAFVLLAAADLRLMFPLLIWVGLYLVLVRWTMRRVGPASKASSDARSQVTGRVVDSYTNIQAVKLFAGDARELGYARDSIEHARRTFAAEMRIFSIMDVALTLLNGLLIVGVVGWAIGLWAGGHASVGVVAAATALTLRLNAMTGWIMWALSSFLRSLGVVAEGLETISQPIDLTDKPGAKTLKLDRGEIEFQNISHHYGQGQGGVSDFSLRIGSGEKIALVGRSGAGKSTLVKLLLRFYDPEAGQILIDGQPIQDVTQDSLRRVIGMVSQDVSLMHRSIRENILYARPDASDDALLAAAEQAQADGFIAELRDGQGRSGYDVLVGERGVKLSGGQRQRIALARVILKDAPILVLDEATSALDSEVEAAIHDSLYQVMAGKTVIAIAHRLSTIAHMDRIVVIDDGQIVEQGTHQSLLQRNGLYARFWQRQSGGFLGTDHT